MTRVFFAFFLAGFCALFSPVAASAKDINFVFATAAQGREILTKRDDYIERLSPFDRAARMKSDKDVTDEQFLKYLGDQTLEWTDDEKTQMLAAIDNFRPNLKNLPETWPDPVLLVKSTGNDEGGLSYTRANAVIMPVTRLKDASREVLSALIAHELFHVLSRSNPDLRKKLYAAIGFKPCGEVAFPPRLREGKIGNPDGPRIDQCIRVTVFKTKKSVWVTPITYANPLKYDPALPDMYSYLQLRFLPVNGGTEDEPPTAATYDAADVELLDLGQITGFAEQVGLNAESMFHPDEILADNFSALLTDKQNIPSPDVLSRIRAVLLNL